MKAILFVLALLLLQRDAAPDPTLQPTILSQYPANGSEPSSPAVRKRVFAGIAPYRTHGFPGLDSYCGGYCIPPGAIAARSCEKVCREDRRCIAWSERPTDPLSAWDSAGGRAPFCELYDRVPPQTTRRVRPSYDPSKFATCLLEDAPIEGDDISCKSGMFRNRLRVQR